MQSIRANQDDSRAAAACPTELRHRRGPRVAVVGRGGFVNVAGGKQDHLARRRATRAAAAALYASDPSDLMHKRLFSAPAYHSHFRPLRFDVKMGPGLETFHYAVVAAAGGGDDVNGLLPTSRSELLGDHL